MKSDSNNRSAEPTVTFWGAAQSVTGSMHLVDTGTQRLLLDCGLVRGPREEAHPRNSHFPFDPTSIDAVLLSHAHVDHCGNLPNLVRQGFSGPIYCTPATRDLIGIMLADSARIQEENALVAGVMAGRAPAQTRRPLYNRADAERTVQQCLVVPYDQPWDIHPSLQLRFLDAGHILGSAIVSLTIAQAGRDYRLTFTGDLGRRGFPFLKDPSPVPAADLLISESTYGGRAHDPVESMAERMRDIVVRTRDRGGKVLIPAFSLGRTQVVVHYLQRWMARGVLPRLPIFVDSPLAAEIAHVYQRHPDLLREPPGEVDLEVEYLLSPDEARERSMQSDPCIIVASGGMCEGGRIVPHLRLHVDDPRFSIVLVSYQAPQTLGAQLLEKRPSVRFHGRTWNKWAEVVELNGFSGHADHNDFLTLLGPAVSTTKKVRLVHGEPPQAESLANALREQGFPDVAVPHREETVSLGG
jgi:metallo-beta-lactamase family protein